MSLTGRLRHRVDVHRLTVSVDSDGSTVEEWGVLFSGLAAEVLTGPGREAVMANTPIGETDLRVALRWFPGLKYEDRVVWQDKAYNILEMLVDRTATREYRLRLKEMQDYEPLVASSSSSSQP